MSKTTRQILLSCLSIGASDGFLPQPYVDCIRHFVDRGLRSSMPLDLARIHAICFDVDGTLRDTDDQFVQCLEGWLRPARILFRPARPASVCTLAGDEK